MALELFWTKRHSGVELVGSAVTAVGVDHSAVPFAVEHLGLVDESVALVVVVVVVVVVAPSATVLVIVVPPRIAVAIPIIVVVTACEVRKAVQPLPILSGCV